ncbi:hypothetical protein ACFXA3_10610 [Streptomyces sp. NPDC059456]|uniref:hypothetical protein n=1 Tax=Streptomyces sp. NPDC059456 TaxID=3346838 RepID=UPI0036AE6082
MLKPVLMTAALAVALIVADRLLASTWAQWSATFVLCGGYALGLSTTRAAKGTGATGPAADGEGDPHHGGR